MLQAHDRLYIDQEQFARTIPIPTCGIVTVDFLLSEDDATRLYEPGQEAAEELLKRWDFNSYKGEFLGRKKQSRGDRGSSPELKSLLVRGQ